MSLAWESGDLEQMPAADRLSRSSRPANDVLTAGAAVPRRGFYVVGDGPNAGVLGPDDLALRTGGAPNVAAATQEHVVASLLSEQGSRVELLALEGDARASAARLAVAAASRGGRR